MKLLRKILNKPTTEQGDALEVIPEQPSDKRRKLKQAKAVAVASVPVSIGVGMGVGSAKKWLAGRHLDKKFGSRMSKLADNAGKEIEVAKSGMVEGIKRGVRGKAWQKENFNATVKNINEALGGSIGKLNAQKAVQLKRASARASNLGLKVGAATLLTGLGTAAYLAKRKVSHKSINDDNI